MSEIEPGDYWVRGVGGAWETARVWIDEMGVWLHVCGDEDPYPAQEWEFGPRLEPPEERVDTPRTKG